MANQMVSTGNAITPPSGSAQLAVPRGGQLLGWWANATTTVVLYDAATTTNLPTAKLNATACNLGWNPFPLEFTAGLVVNAGASITLIVQ